MLAPREATARASRGGARATQSVRLDRSGSAAVRRLFERRREQRSDRGRHHTLRGVASILFHKHERRIADDPGGCRQSLSSIDEPRRAGVPAVRPEGHSRRTGRRRHDRRHGAAHEHIEGVMRSQIAGSRAARFNGRQHRIVRGQQRTCRSYCPSRGDGLRNVRLAELLRAGSLVPPLSVVVSLGGGGGTLMVPVSAPSGSVPVPRCDAPGEPSTISISDVRLG